MKIIIGLGNPEPKYLMNFHNLGFMAIDKFANGNGISFTEERKLKCYIGKTKLCGENVILVKPTTYMNLSGECVRAVVDYYKADLKDVLVIYDDLDIDTGSIRIRPNGQSGTHNGMRNIVQNLSTTEFPRIRIGSKPVEELKNVPILDYVLMNIPSDLQPIYKKVFERTDKIIADFISGKDFDKIMCEYNGKAN